MIPTEEQLFDYHIGATDHQLSSQIEAYLKEHPAAQQKLKDFDSLESAFSNFQATEPPERVVQQVQAMARKELKPGAFDFLKNLNFRRSFAWAMMVFVVIGLSVALKELRESGSYMPGISASPVAKNAEAVVTQEATANYTGSLTEKALNPVLVDAVEGTALKQYTQALGFYHQSLFKDAATLFSKVMASDPGFSKKADLYTFWIKSLTKMGDSKAAAQKQAEWDKIQALQKTETF